MFIQGCSKESLSGSRGQDKTEVNPEFEALLDYLKHSQKCDLTSYKRASLMRRFQYRMSSLNIDTYENYLQYLQCHADEYLALLNDVLINVTSFFRDQGIWQYLAAEVIPKIIADKQPNEAIRVWSAGCATGQEIYSLVILLAEALGIEACLQRVRCFATDADEAAFKQARQATYSSLDVIDIPSNLLKKYFNQTEQGYVFCPQLRRSVFFAHHDLTKNAPMSRIDLLLCRNVLMYFKSEAQASVLVRFHFALKSTGFLVLGKTEALPGRGRMFELISASHRVYLKGSNLELNDYLHLTSHSSKRQAGNLFPLQN